MKVERYAFGEISELDGTNLEEGFGLFSPLNRVIERGKYEIGYLLAHLEEVAVAVTSGENIDDIFFHRNSFSQEVKKLLKENKTKVQNILDFIHFKTMNLQQEIERCLNGLQKIQDICDFEAEVEEIHNGERSALIFITFPVSEEEGVDMFITEIAFPLYTLRNLESLQMMFTLLDNYSGEISIEIHPKFGDGEQFLDEVNSSSEISGFNILHGGLVKKEFGKLELIIDTYGIPPLQNLKEILKICQQLHSLGAPEITFNKKKEPIAYEVLRLLRQGYSDGHIQVFFSDIVYFFAQELEIDPNYLFSLIGETENEYLRQIIEREFLEFSKEEDLVFHDGWKGESINDEKDEEEDIDTQYDRFLDLFSRGEDFMIRWAVRTSRPGVDIVTGEEEETSFLESGHVIFSFPFFTNNTFQKIKKLNRKKTFYKGNHYFEFITMVSLVVRQKEERVTKQFQDTTLQIEKKLKNSIKALSSPVKYMRGNFSDLDKVINLGKYTHEQVYHTLVFISELYKKNFRTEEDTDLIVSDLLKETLFKLVSQRKGDIDDILEFIDEKFPSSYLELPVFCSSKELEEYFFRLLYYMAYSQKESFDYTSEEQAYENLVNLFSQDGVEELTFNMVNLTDESQIKMITFNRPFISKENYQKLLEVYAEREKLSKTLRIH